LRLTISGKELFPPSGNLAIIRFQNSANASVNVVSEEKTV
jgi:hypothetical protein